MLEANIQSFGKTIFEEIGNTSPSFFKKNFWSRKGMELAMSRPEFKRDMFRLVDVLPTLSSSESVIEHTKQYLSESIKEFHPWLSKALKFPSKSIIGSTASWVIRKSVSEMASQYIIGNTASSALKQLKTIRAQRLAFTADLLGEFCVCEKEAVDYLTRYLDCLSVFGKEVPKWKKESQQIVANHPGESSPICISVKLTALYSQCSPLNFKKSVDILSERLSTIVSKAKEVDALIYVDAEDSANNPIIFETFKTVFTSPEFKDFPFPGIVVQLYSKDSEDTIKSLLKSCENRSTPIAIRLVKGAYWDYETITCKQNHWESPLYSVKEHTDANYEKISKYLLDNHKRVLPAFASHNIRSLANACCYAEQLGLPKTAYELQMLYGMAEPIAFAFRNHGYLVRYYSPIGELLPGMGYLVRRLLENTSNESFLKHTFFDEADIPKLLRAPEGVERSASVPALCIP